jgi:hypothetical protein
MSFVTPRLDPRPWPLARKSISDWKSVYLPERNGCDGLDRCGGFFQSGTRIRSARIHALTSIVGRVV